MAGNLTVFRNEKKYMMSLTDSILLQEELGKLLRPDAHSRDGAYKVRSLYFDSLDNVDYVEKDEGVQFRKKIRLRVYDAKDKTAKLELKEKNGDLQHKSSLIVDRQQAKRLQDCDYSVLLDIAQLPDIADYTRQLAYRFYSIMTLGVYRPVALIEYDRRAFIYDEFNTRITIDQAVRSSEFDLDVYCENPEWNVLLSEEHVLEVKYDGKLFYPISQLLKKYRITNVSYSKYGNGRVLLEPYL